MDFAKQKTEGARETYSILELTGTKEKLHALSFSRLRRQLPPGGSLRIFGLTEAVFCNIFLETIRFLPYIL